MKKQILFTVLDWGLGHASRSLSVIKKLLIAGHSVDVASSGMALKFLKLHLEFQPLELPSYNIKYPAHRYFEMHFALQYPKFKKLIYREHKLIQEYCSKKKYDYIISDNRYGCYHADVESIFLGHQVNPALGYGRHWINKLHHSFLRGFDQFWILDDEQDRIAQPLSNIGGLPIPAKYVGYPKRWTDLQQVGDEILVMLSGPEPARSVLEKALSIILKDYPTGISWIRGTDQPREFSFPEHWEVIDMADNDIVRKYIERSAIVVSRSGYSSVMDFLQFGIRAILIPTRGQSEQELLAQNLKTKRWFNCVNEVDLESDLLQKISESLQSKPIQLDMECDLLRFL